MQGVPTPFVSVGDDLPGPLPLATALCGGPICLDCSERGRYKCCGGVGTRYKTRLCKYYLQGTCRRNPCTFAHAPVEIRPGGKGKSKGKGKNAGGGMQNASAKARSENAIQIDQCSDEADSDAGALSERGREWSDEDEGFALDDLY